LRLGDGFGPGARRPGQGRLGGLPVRGGPNGSAAVGSSSTFHPKHRSMPMPATSSSSPFKPKLWVPGDWNALFGFGTNILVNLLTLSGLLLFVLQMPRELVFGRILPAAGLMMCLSTGYYAWLAYKLAKTTGRSDVCALPSGISVPHMFIVTLVIMLPVKL